jgi:hypothetical protein
MDFPGKSSWTFQESPTWVLPWFFHRRVRSSPVSGPSLSALFPLFSFFLSLFSRRPSSSPSSVVVSASPLSAFRRSRAAIDAHRSRWYLWWWSHGVAAFSGGNAALVRVLRLCRVHRCSPCLARSIGRFVRWLALQLLVMSLPSSPVTLVVVASWYGGMHPSLVPFVVVVVPRPFDDSSARSRFAHHCLRRLRSLLSSVRAFFCSEASCLA